MVFRKQHIASSLIIITSFFNCKAFAQSQLNTNKKSYWASTKKELTNDKIRLSIEYLKKAEASIDDSIIAQKLESLGYLAVAASGFSSTKKDKYQRTGWWMLTYPIAIKYGLTINSIIDERKDLQKSTIAANAYWKDLKAVYKNDNISDLVFLTSSISVDKFYPDSINFPNQFKNIRKVEKTLLNIKKLYDSQRFKIYIGPTQPVSSLTSDQIISFESIHHFIQIPTAELEQLNPQWVSNIYNPQFGALFIPATYKKDFEKHEAAMVQKTKDDQIMLATANKKRMKLLLGDIPDLDRYKPIRYKVKMGDNLGRIAQRYHVKISSIRSWNELNSDRIYAGQRLTIYIPKHQKNTVAKPVSTPPKSKLKTGEYQEYTVKPGDTLWGISQQFNKISADVIMEDNGINENISPGQVLKIRSVK